MWSHTQQAYSLGQKSQILFIPEVSFLKQIYCLKFTLVERRPIQAKTKLPSQNTATTIITTHLPAISKNPSLQGVVEVLDFQFLEPPGLFLHSWMPSSAEWLCEILADSGDKTQEAIWFSEPVCVCARACVRVRVRVCVCTWASLVAQMVQNACSKFVPKKNVCPRSLPWCIGQTVYLGHSDSNATNHISHYFHYILISKIWKISSLLLVTGCFLLESISVWWMFSQLAWN